MKLQTSLRPVTQAVSMVILAAAVAMPSFSVAEQIRLCRYRNANGVMVTSQDIPAEFAKKGYDIVSINGTLLQRIPPELTPEEKEKAEKDKQLKLSEAQQKESDKQLLLRYSTIDEVKNAKLRKIGEISSKLKMLESNQSTLKQQMEIEQQKAAGFERSGRPVAPVVLQRMDALSQELKSTDAQIQARKQEVDAETAKYDQEIQRFSYLESLRNPSAAAPADNGSATPAKPTKPAGK